MVVDAAIKKVGENENKNIRKYYSALIELVMLNVKTV